MNHRKPLTHAGGAVKSDGDAKVKALLVRALENSNPEDRDFLTHGFHSYAARMHPTIARTIIEEFADDKQRVLDPFCGSGTVMIEAMRAGRISCGSDINPLALRLSKVKCQRRDSQSRKEFAKSLREISVLSTERVQERRPIHAKLPKSEIQWYAPHVVKELAGIYAEIEKIKNKRDKLALQILFSAIVVKFSKQQSDTSERMVEKRIRKGLCTEFFERKGLELVRRWEDLHNESPNNAAEPKFVMSDARSLPKELNKRFDLLLTSPPYAGTYNYADHHKRRMAWLGLRSTDFHKNEIGARRQQSPTLKQWDNELHQVLKACSALMTRDAKLVLMLGDGQLRRKRIDANHQVRSLAPKAGLRWVAHASQSRPDWTGGRSRQEHLIMLQRKNS